MKKKKKTKKVMLNKINKRARPIRRPMKNTTKLNLGFPPAFRDAM